MFQSFNTVLEKIIVLQHTHHQYTNQLLIMLVSTKSHSIRSKDLRSSWERVAFSKNLENDNWQACEITYWSTTN